MSKPEPCRLRPRFKGIENFLRRVAFNLGNSPSQTEVKIISCIPIDVTDLQNKIVELERELDQRLTEPKADCPGPVVVHTALVGAPLLHPAAPTPTPGLDSEHDQRLSSHCDDTTDAPGTSHACAAHSSGKLNKKDSELLQKFKKMEKKSKGRAQMVYFAQTENINPFHGNEQYLDAGYIQEQVVDTMSHDYLADVVRRQYQPEQLGADSSFTSNFSSPMCRSEPTVVTPLALDSEVCSCCHGHFHDLDAAVRDAGFLQHGPLPPEPSARRDHSMYYDASFYDVIPVKEKPTKQRKDDNLHDVREVQFGACDTFSKKFRAQCRHQPYVVNYSAAPAPLRPNHRRHYRSKLPMKSLNRRDHVLNSMQKRKLDKHVSVESSRSCSIECGDFYMKPVYQKLRPQKRLPKPPLPPAPPLKAVLLKNAECLTTSLNDTECQTATSRSVQLEPPPPEENKTEITLNQIKTILHAVLAEVKTNSQLKNDVEDKAKMDAIVQKGQSQSNIAARSSLMNSFTYSPYNLTPYGASCSAPMTGSQLYPSLAPAAEPLATSAFTPLKCLQNYPLFIQTTGRQCACCFRNIPAPVPTVTTAKGGKHTAHTTATNTETVLEKRSRETEKLIKEIYKSLAVSMDYPAKDTSNSDYPELKSSDNTSPKIHFKYEPKAKLGPTSEVVKNTEVRGTSPTPLFRSRTFDGHAGSNAASFRSELVSKTTSSSRAESRGDKLRSLLGAKELQSTGSERDPPTPRRGQQQVVTRSGTNGDSYSDDDTETASSEDDSDATVVNTDKPEKKEKKGLFSKMVKLFTTKRRRKKSDTTSDREDDPASDSDDYETIYSQHSAGRARHVKVCEPPPRPRPRRPHCKLSYTRHYAPRRDPPRRHSPYMEQEYRRNWNEKLAFHERDSPRYSSQRPYSRESVRRYPPPQPYPYYRDYEARAAMVHPTPAPKQPDTRPPGRYTQMSPPPPTENKVIVPKAARSATKGLSWLKKHKLGVHCGENWKRLILDG